MTTPLSLLQTMVNALPEAKLIQFLALGEERLEYFEKRNTQLETKLNDRLRFLPRHASGSVKLHKENAEELQATIVLKFHGISFFTMNIDASFPEGKKRRRLDIRTEKGNISFESERYKKEEHCDIGFDDNIDKIPLIGSKVSDKYQLLRKTLSIFDVPFINSAIKRMEELNVELDEEEEE